MNFVPVLVMNGLLLIITIVLLIADKLLVSYGDCKISVLEGDEVKEITVDGGINLLTALNDNGFNVSNSCGGKGSCGYCKVQVPEGGGQILPTEEIWMSRQEKLNNMRLFLKQWENFQKDFLENHLLYHSQRLILMIC